jgi:hypothetical protein
MAAVILADQITMVVADALVSLVAEVIIILTQAHQDRAAELLVTAVHLPAAEAVLSVVEAVTAVQEVRAAPAVVLKAALVAAGINFTVTFFHSNL